MKRYRITKLQFDSRAHLLSPAEQSWDESARVSHEQSRARAIDDLAHEFGPYSLDSKIQNAIDLGPMPFSVLAFHNGFLAQARDAFIHGQYYPALTAATCLGERILNHLILGLRDVYRHHAATRKKVLKKTCENWKEAISALSSWGVLTDPARSSLLKLHRHRNAAVHFEREVDRDSRSPALQAIKTLQGVIEAQFSALW